MGVECALLAQMGWTANPDLFGPGGFFDAFCGGVADPAALVEGFGQPFRIADPGVGFKKYPCNYFTHRPIDAALALRAEHAIAPHQIAGVDVVFPAFDYVNRPAPATGLDGKFSVQYTTAAALLDGHVAVASFSNERRFAADMADLLPRVHLVVDPSIPNDFARMHVELRIALRDGRTVSRRLQELSGFVGYPLSRDERLRKYYSCAEGVIGRAEADRVLALSETLEDLAELGTMMELLRSPASRPG
jgi:aconitate decarboxylase